MNTTALNAALQGAKAEYNNAVYLQTINASRQEANAAKLSAQQSAEEKWRGAYDSAFDQGNYGNGSDLKAGKITISEGVKSEFLFSAYADAKVKNYDADALEHYSDLDTNYDLTVSTLDAQVTELAAMIEGLEESVSTSAQDTGLLGG